MTHGSTLCLGLNTDATAVKDLEVFADSIIEGFTEVLSLGPGGSPRRLE